MSASTAIAGAGVAVQTAQTQVNMALSMLKHNADVQKQTANILQEAVLEIANSSRGNNVNISA